MDPQDFMHIRLHNVNLTCGLAISFQCSYLIHSRDLISSLNLEPWVALLLIWHNLIQFKVVRQFGCGDVHLKPSR